MLQIYVCKSPSFFLGRPVDKHQTFVEVDTISFYGHGQPFPKYPK